MEECTRKQLIKLYREAFTKISKLKLKKIDPRLTFKFDEIDESFSILIFDKGLDNRTFYFWKFEEESTLRNRLDDMVSLIAKDDFEKIKKASGC